jgi:hypothetical protein
LKLCNFVYATFDNFFEGLGGRRQSKIQSPKPHLAPSAKIATDDPSRFANRDKRSHVLGERGWSRA